MSKAFNAEIFLENANERASDQFGDPDGDSNDIFNIDTASLISSLQITVREAIEAWQIANNLTFSGHSFLKSRNIEYIKPVDEETPISQHG